MVDVSALRNELIQRAQDAAQNAVTDMVSDLKAAAPVLTGATRDATDSSLLSQSDQMISYRVFSDTDQAGFVEFGTSAHDVSGNPFLAFPWPNAPSNLKPNKSGVYVFRSVHIPAMAARPWFTPIAEQWANYLNNNFN